MYYLVLSVHGKLSGGIPISQLEPASLIRQYSVLVREMSCMFCTEYSVLCALYSVLCTPSYLVRTSNLEVIYNILLVQFGRTSIHPFDLVLPYHDPFPG